MPSAAFQWHTFLDTPPEEHVYEPSRFVVIPVPYDGTTSFRSGARYGPAAIIDASRQLEDFDIETGVDASACGIYTLPEISPDLSGPDRVIEQVRDIVAQVLADRKTPALLGGEHTVTVGAVQACAARYPDLSVLYLDAHADLRDSYMGTRWGHASVARRIFETCPIAQVGVRSISRAEYDFALERGLPIHHWPPARPVEDLIADVCAQLSPRVYVSVDLDALDPSIMPAVGTPEPGGMSWWDVTSLLAAVARQTQIVGFDIVELSPEEGPVACSSTAARLAYKLAGYIVAGAR